MNEQLELFDIVFDWKYVFQQIRGRKAIDSDHLGIPEIDKWGRSQNLQKFSLVYPHLTTTRKMASDGIYDRTVEHGYEL